MRNSLSILGVPIDRVTLPQAVDIIDTFVRDGGFHQVATANTDFIVNALGDPELQHILGSAGLVTADGMPLLWAARALGGSLPERVTGVDIVPQIAALAADRGYRLFLLGAREDVARRAAAALIAENPGLLIAGCMSPPLVDPEDADSPASNALIESIREARPDILLVAFGNPKQEKWIYRRRAAFGEIPVCMGVGATFDFLAGEAKRAPVWMQRHGLEWLHRLCQNPARLWRRYNRDFWIFGTHLLKEALSTRRAPATQRTGVVGE